MPLNQALDSNNAEMTKRLKYTKDILTHMLNNNQPAPNTRSNDLPSSDGFQTSSNSQNSQRRMMNMNSNPMNGFGVNSVNSASVP